MPPLRSVQPYTGHHEYLAGSVNQESKIGKHTWVGWQTSVSDAPHPTSVLYGANLRVSSTEDSPVSEGKVPDYVLDLLKQFNLPV
jgi:hypothetical protein